MATDPERVKALFLAAIERSDPALRRVFLDGEVGDDELRDRLEALLAAYDRPPSALDRPLGADPQATDAPNAPRSVSAPPPAETWGDGTTVSPPKDDGPNLIDTIIADRYKIRQEIGEGGMGTVYLAEQLRPIRRQVALKLIKPGMDSRNVLARFESERQALALMEHPNIARVLDAGATADGRPFFVMELVKGVPITEYCDAHRLDLNVRLALVRQVCSAVQHAHQKGIIHRDLKPSNILVEAHDPGAPGVPKVIDFGLAKATSGLRLSEQSLFTAFGSVAGTPLYMAPEQARFNALDVDTRADIYALGAILYELLTGTTPIARESIRQAALDEMLRVIREVEPPAPSSRISTSEALPSLAAARQVEPARLSRLVRGDLDWIVMKALAKERERRYASAIALADDIERHLNHEPVSAGPPTAAYRFRKFVRRNRARVIAASLVLLALVAGIVGTTLGLLEAKRQERIAIAEAKAKEEAWKAEALQRQEAEKRLGQIEKANQILGSIFKDLNPEKNERENKPLSALLGERLAQATAQIEGEAIGDPLAVARMQLTLGVSQLGLGYPERAVELFAKARATFANELGPDHPETLVSMRNLAWGYEKAGQLDRALPLYEETLALEKSKLGPDHPDTLSTMNDLGVFHLRTGRVDRALPLLEEVLALRKSELGPDHPDTLEIMNNLAGAYTDAGRNDRALALHEETVALCRAKFGPEHIHTLTGMNNLAWSYRQAGKLDLALRMFEEVHAPRKSKLGPDHPDTLNSMNNLALTYSSTGKLDRSIAILEEVLKLRTGRSGADHPDTVAAKANLGKTYGDAGRLAEALPLLEEASRMSRRLPRLRWVGSSLLDAYLRAGDIDKAAALAREQLTEVRTDATVDSLRRAGTMAQIGHALLQAKAWTEAEPVIREALAIREAKEPDAWTTFNTRSLLGGALLGQKKYADAEPLLRAGYEGMKQRTGKIPPPSKVRLVEALDRLIGLAEATNRPEELKRWKDEKARLPRASLPNPEAIKK
jgi:serine/threonine protein kinase